MEELAGVGGPRPISGAELEALAQVEQRTFDRLSGAIALQRASTRELHWLLCRAACRGVAEPVLDRQWEPDALVIVARRTAALHTSRSNTISGAAPTRPPPRRSASRPRWWSRRRREPPTSRFSARAPWPRRPSSPAPRSCSSTHLKARGFPVDAAIYVRWIGNREALGQVRKRILDVEHAYREQLEGASGPGVLAEEDRELAREYEAVLQSSAHPPMLRASLSLAVGAADREELERRVGALRERFGEVALHRPRGLQHALFVDHLPQPGRRLGARLPASR